MPLAAVSLQLSHKGEDSALSDVTFRARSHRPAFWVSADQDEGGRENRQSLPAAQPGPSPFPLPDSTDARRCPWCWVTGDPGKGSASYSSWSERAWGRWTAL